MGGYAVPAPAPAPRELSAPAPLTPAQRADEAAVELSRLLDSVDVALGAVRTAHAANDPERWTAARTQLSERLCGAAHAADRVLALAQEGGQDAAARVDAVAQRLAVIEREAAAAVEAPSGLESIAREAEIHSVLAAPIQGSVAAAYAQKEAALRELLGQLDAQDSRVLAARLRRARPNDPLATAFGRMTNDRRARVLQFLDDARRREWVRREDLLRKPWARRPAPQEAPLAAAAPLLAAEHARSAAPAEAAKREAQHAPNAAAGPTLPPGVDYQPIGAAGELLIRVSWFTRDGADLSQARIYAPTRWPHLLRALKTHVFWWMPETAFEHPETIYLHGPIHPRGEVMRTSPPAPALFSRIGLPPHSTVEWLFEADAGYEIITASVLPHLEDLPDGWSRKRIPPEIEERSERLLFQKAGLAPPRISMVLDRTAKLHKEASAIVTRVPAEHMRALLGARWDDLVKGSSAGEPPAASLFEGVAFDNSISIEDRQYFIAWTKRVYGAAPGRIGAPPDAANIDTLRRIDAHPLKAQILARLQQASPDGARSIWRDLDRLIHDVQEAAVHEQHGLTTAVGATAGHEAPPRVHAGPASSVTAASTVASAAGPRARYHARPITGEIVNESSLARAGRELALHCSTSDGQGPGFVAVAIRWIATPVGKPAELVREGVTTHFAHHEPARWKVRFDQVGTYHITAFVDHQSYWPAHFETFVEVKTEEDRLDEVEAAAFGDLGAQTNRTGRRELFEVSWTNDRLGDDKYTFGDLIEGEVPAGFQRRSLEERVRFIAADHARLERLIARYEGERRHARGARDIVAYARHALASLTSTRQRICEDGKDLAPFEIRGAFLSERAGVRSGTLSLIGLAGRRRADGAAQTGPRDDAPTIVRIHDLTQLYEPRSAVYTGEDRDFREAIEDAFVDLCKSYPPGRVSVLFEQLGTDGRPSGKTMGFELHTGTAWKDVRSTVWDGKVQLAVNLVAAAAAVFIPGAALVTIPLVTAYNATDTLATLAELHRKGQATWKDGFEAGLSIGLDLLPFLGRMTKAGKLGGTALLALDVAQTTTNVVVLAEQGIARVGCLRDRHITAIAALAEEIEYLRRVNDSDPRIAEKEREQARLIAAARGAAAEAFAEMAKSGAVMVFAPVAFNHLIAGRPTRTAKELEAAGMFVHEPGVEPRYDPETGRIHGDRSRLDDVRIKALQEAYLLDVYRQHAEIAAILGVRPESVALLRKPGHAQTTVAQNSDGIWEITAPAGRPHARILDDVWGQRARSATAPTERPARLVGGDYTPVFHAKDLLELGRPVIVGDRIASRTDAEAILSRLARGDRRALAELGVSALPKGFDPRGVEWGLGRLPDGTYVLVRGHHGEVDWSPFPEVVPIAHTHSLRHDKLLAADGGTPGIHIDDLALGRGANAQNRARCFPSAADVAFVVRNGLAMHVVHTPYVHAGDRRVGNAVGDFSDLPRVTFEITEASRIGSHAGQADIPIYRAALVAKDSDGAFLWSGTVYAIHHPSVGSHLELELPASWTQPGAGGSPTHLGGSTAAPTRAPASEREERGLADWKQLEASNRDYAGRYDNDEWLDRYEQGLVFDLEHHVWRRPDGKVYTAQRFDDTRWTAKKIFRYLTGDDAQSGLQRYVSMLEVEGIADRAAVIRQIDALRPLGKTEDTVRHALKAHFEAAILQRMTAPPTEAGKHAAMRRITERLAPADKGSLTEKWYQHVVLHGQGNPHVAARKDALEGQGVALEKDRFIDFVHGGTAHEIKSGEGKLSADDLSQMRDYARMVDGRARVKLGDGTTATIERVQYTFTSPAGARANVETLKKMFKPPFAGRFAVEIFTPSGNRVLLTKESELTAQSWLFE
ncbi:MAG TPA: hypothetical protein VNO30_14955 [Kofleriaceae bacterium]|nr:hypothetical protein [Kofleriaceae bacterium]